MADIRTRLPAVPERLRHDFEALADEALTAFVMIDDLVRDGGRLQGVAEYLASTGDELACDMDAWDRLADYLTASGYQAFSDVMHLIYDALESSTVIGGHLTAEGREAAQGTITALQDRRLERAARDS